MGQIGDDANDNKKSSNSNDLPNKPGKKKAENSVWNKVFSPKLNQIETSTVESIADFIQIIGRITTLGFSFFRGDKYRCDYTLSPKVYSPAYKSLLSHLDESIDEFAALTTSRNSIISNGFLEDMINAQHYELPTRLLDWSESALIALYFSVNPEKSQDDSVVWALNPIALNSKSTFLRKYGYIPIFPSKQDKQLVEDLENYYKAPRENSPKYPIAIKTRKVNPRIDAQRGVFVLFCHNDECKCLTRYEDAHLFLHKIVIPHDKAEDIKRELISLGITQYSVFPELKAISIDLMNKYNKGGY